MFENWQLLNLLGNRNFRKLDLSVTNRCNLRCTNCGIWEIYKRDPARRKTELTVPEYRAFFAKYGFWNQISFTGGEPTLRPDLQQIIDAALKECRDLHSIGINSNSSYPARLLEVVSHTLDGGREINVHVTISMDGPEATHDTTRGRSGNWRQSVDTYSRLKDLRHKRLAVQYHYTVSRCNAGRLRELIECGAIDPGEVIVSFAHESYRYGPQGSSPVPDLEASKAEVAFFLSRYKVRSLKNLGQWVFLRHYQKGRRIRCVAGQNTFHMDPYGRINRCTLIDQELGSARELLLEGETPPRDCHCYTPCESYFGIGQSRIRSLWQAIRP